MSPIFQKQIHPQKPQQYSLTHNSALLGQQRSQESHGSQVRMQRKRQGTANQEMLLQLMLTKRIKHTPQFRAGAQLEFKTQQSSTNPGYTPLSLVANFHQQKSSSIGLQQRCERQGHKKGEGKFYPPGNSNDNINPLIE